MTVSTEALLKELSNGINSFKTGGTIAKLFQVEEAST